MSSTLEVNAMLPIELNLEEIQDIVSHTLRQLPTQKPSLERRYEQ